MGGQFPKGRNRGISPQKPGEPGATFRPTGKGNLGCAQFRMGERGARVRGWSLPPLSAAAVKAATEGKRITPPRADAPPRRLWMRPVSTTPAMAGRDAPRGSGCRFAKREI